MADFGILSAFGGGSIGTALVKLQLDSRQYQAELATAEGQTRAAATGMESGLARFSGIAKAGLAVAGAAAIKFAADSIASYQESEQVLAQLSNAVGENTQAYEAQAHALQTLTGVQDEEIIKAQTLLSRFKLTGDQVRALTPLVLDFAQATGQSVEASASSIGKALLGNARALKAIGVDYKLTGDRAQDFSNIVDALSEKVGGAAAANAETLAGKLEILAARFDDLKERVGAFLVGPLETLMAKLESDEDRILGYATAVTTGALAWEDFQNKLNSGVGVDAQGRSNIIFFEAADAIESMQRAAMQGSFAEAELARQAELAGKSVDRFAGMTEKATDELVSNAAEGIESALDLADAWEGSTEDAIDSIEDMVKQARRMARDFKALDEEAVPEKFKAFLIQEGPEAVHDFVTGTEKQKDRFIRAWKQYEDATTRAINNMKRVAGPGGIDVGRLMAEGMISGLRQLAPSIAAQAESAVLRATAAARAAAQAQSPSKTWMELGYDMAEGLVQGLASSEDAVVEEAERIIDKAIEKLERKADELERRLDRLRSRAESFRSSISSGFDRFLDFSDAFGMSSIGDILSFGQAQLTGARQLADVLKALTEQGASKALLQQVAQGGASFGQAILQGGPSGIAQLNEVFASIADIQSGTSGGITDKFFESQIDRLERKLDRLHEDLQVLRHPQRLDVRGVNRDALDAYILSVLARAQLQRTPV